MRPAEVGLGMRTRKKRSYPGKEMKGPTWLVFMALTTTSKRPQNTAQGTGLWPPGAYPSARGRAMLPEVELDGWGPTQSHPAHLGRPGLPDRSAAPHCPPFFFRGSSSFPFLLSSPSHVPSFPLSLLLLGFIFPSSPPSTSFLLFSSSCLLRSSCLLLPSFILLLLGLIPRAEVALS